MTEAPKENETGDAKSHLYKVLVLGDYAVGKTSLIKRYTEGFFTPNYKLTIGVDFAVKVLEWNENTTVNLQLWDIAGHERFGSMTRVYYKYAIAAIIVFDLSRPATFDAVLKWKEDVNNKVVLANNQPIPCLLLANKADLPGVTVDTQTLDNFAKAHNFIGWFPTSAMNNTNVEDAMKFLVQKVLDISQMDIPQQPENPGVKIDNDGKKKPEGGGCCGMWSSGAQSS